MTTAAFRNLARGENDFAPQVRTFTAHDAPGAAYRWAFWRDPRVKGGGLWFLRDPEGYVRPLERVWTDCVPRIRMILENHGQTAEVS